MSNLMKMSLLQTNEHLNKRVHAAVIQIAQQQRDSQGSSGAFANLVLSNLNRSWPEFILGSSADQHIQAASVINENNTAIITTEVNDDQIRNVINGTWANAANKYTPQSEGGEE